MPDSYRHHSNTRITAIRDTPSSGLLTVGNTVDLTLSLSQAVTVAGGKPTLTLNDGGVATYISGSGTDALTFAYTVAAGQKTGSLAATAVNLNGATIDNRSGNEANLAITGIAQTGPQIGATAVVPTVTAIADTPGTGALDAGKTVSLALTLSQAVTVAGGKPTLTLNDGGVATYVSGSGTDALTFAYTIVAGQNTGSLAATGVSLNGATIDNASGTAASLTLAGITQAGPQIDTTAPVVTAVTDTPATGVLTAGSTDILALKLTEAVTVAGGKPTLTLNDGGVATYVSGSGTGLLDFSYTVAAGQTTASLAATGVSLNGATIADAAGNAASLALTGIAQTGPQIGATAVVPTVTAIADTPGTGALDAGKTVSLALTLSQAVTVAGGKPTLTLNDGGVATYVSGSGTDALTFAYTIVAGQNTGSLAATGVSLNGATIDNASGTAASLTLAGITQAGPQIDTTAPVVTAVTDTPATGVLTAGSTDILALKLTEAVTVAGGKPTLTLNDGGVATYVSGSGTGLLDFSYTVAAGQTTASLAATGVSLNGATIADAAGNAASLALTGIAQTGPQIGASVQTGAGPVTPLHYTAGANTANGSYNAAGDPGSDGFNLADVSSVAEADAMPDGVKSLIYLGDTSGLTASFESTVNAAATDPNVYGFYVADEPADSAIANLASEDAYIALHAPGKMSFIVAENDTSPQSPTYAITPENTGADLIGLDPYPVRAQFTGGMDLGVIDAAVAEAERVGWSQSQIVPVYQAFGGGAAYASWTLPTASQAQQSLAEWAKLTPTPAFDYTYAWGSQEGDSSLAGSAAS